MLQMERRDIQNLLHDRNGENFLIICLLEEVNNLEGKVVSIEKRDDKFFLVRNGQEYLISTIEAGQSIAERFAGEDEALWIVDSKLEGAISRYQVKLSFFDGGMRISAPKQIYISPERVNWIFQQIPDVSSATSPEEKLKILHNLFFYDNVCFFYYSGHRGTLYLIGKDCKMLKLERYRDANVWKITELCSSGKVEGVTPNGENVVVCHKDIPFLFVSNNIEQPVAKDDENVFLDFLDEYEKIETDILEERKIQAGYLEFNGVEDIVSQKQIKFSISNTRRAALDGFSENISVEVLKSDTSSGKPKNIFVGRISRFELNDKELYVDYEDNEDRAQEFLNINITSGKLGICWTGDDYIHKRRERALNRFRQEQKTPLREVLCLKGKGLDVHALDNPVTDRVQNKFPDISFNEPQRAAIKAAVGTDDIAVIWGPPGTGKTTVIKAIIERFFEYKNIRLEHKEKPVLITSYQNDAVDNVIVSRGIEIPAYRIGKTGTNLFSAWQDAIKEQMEKQLGVKPDYKPWIDKFDSACRRQQPEKINLLKEFMASSLFGKLSQELQYKIRQLVDNEPNFVRSILESQRFTPLAFADDGRARLADLLRLLWTEKKLLTDQFLEEINDEIGSETSITKDKFLLWLNALAEKLEAGDEDACEKFREIVLLLLANLEPEDKEKQVDACLKEIRRILWQQGIDDPKRAALALVQYDFVSQIENIEFAKILINTYTNTMAGTCQKVGMQNRNSKEVLPTSYQMVIVDETSRANVLDLLIPLSMGKKVILVGDFLQLPPLVDDEVKSMLRQRFPDRKELIDKTFFQRLYEFLKKYAPEKCVALTAQRRMHPDIGDFASEQFYKPEGLALSSEEVDVEKKRHGLTMFNGQAVAWVNIPLAKGAETNQFDQNAQSENQKSNRSLYRQIEVEQIRSLVDSIRTQDPNKEIGIITFYKKQAEQLEKRFEDLNVGEQLKIGTVDAFQGKEFDIVFLSCVRSNEQGNIGFLKDRARLCVAFTRAKQLMVVVGDKDTLCDEHAQPKTAPYIFHQFLQLCQSKGSYHE